jgi:hypothetical protein
VAQEPLSSTSENPRSYYGQPVIKPPVWEPTIAVYLFAGGLAGASGTLAALSELKGDDELARRAWLAALAAVAVSPALLIEDLGRPARFLNMMRVVKVSSPMNMGVWILSGAGASIGLASARAWLGWFPRLGGLGAVGAALLGPPLTTYTAVLFSDTAVPSWHEARREMPWLFASSAAASAGAVASAVTAPADAAPARRLAVAGAVAEVGMSMLMERRLGPLLSEPYKSGRTGALSKASRALGATGAGLLAASGSLAGRRARIAAAAGGAMVTAGALCTRFAVFGAGVESAKDPRHTVIPQRRRLEQGEGHRQAEQVARGPS